jgi:hypothetical protein
MVVIVILEKRKAKSKDRSHFGATEIKAFPVNAKAMSSILNYSTTISKVCSHYFITMVTTHNHASWI